MHGGRGRDLLIGGLGADQLLGNDGEDILVGGTTAFDDIAVALDAIMAEWTSERSYADRVANLSGNLRTNGNREQLTAIRDRGLHDWHAAWIDELVDADGQREEV